jgi:hypothetical protein
MTARLHIVEIFLVPPQVSLVPEPSDRARQAFAERDLRLEAAGLPQFRIIAPQAKHFAGHWSESIRIRQNFRIAPHDVGDESEKLAYRNLPIGTYVENLTQATV